MSSIINNRIAEIYDFVKYYIDKLVIFYIDNEKTVKYAKQ